MVIDNILEVSVLVATLIGAIWGLLHYIISNFTRPLISEISRLSESITEFSATVKMLDHRQNETERRLAIAEKTLDAEHTRLDMLHKHITQINDRMNQWNHEVDLRTNKLDKRITQVVQRMHGFDQRLGIFARFCHGEHSGDMRHDVLEALCNPHYGCMHEVNDETKSDSE